MDYLKELGSLALGSRLKRLSDYFMPEVKKVYKSQGIDFEPKWFPLFSLLMEESNISIMECARKLSVSHPAINQIAGSMLKKGIIEEVKDKQDKRKRLIRLSKKGKDLIPSLEPVWSHFKTTLNKMFFESKFDLLGAINEMEETIKEKDFYSRVLDNIKEKQIEEVKIIEYKDTYKKQFKDLNYEWLEKYFFVEKTDIKMLNNPKKSIIDKGGYIFFAKFKNKIVGTVALIFSGKGNYELAKMAVTEGYQGKQIGKKLMQAVIQKGNEIGAEKIFLISNTKLTPAINLYRKSGFMQIPLDQKERERYVRANIKMEIIL